MYNIGKVGDILGKLNQPHDKLFKRFFRYTDITKDFLKNYLPVEIRDMVDLDTISLEDSNHIDKDLKEIYSDMLFSVNINDESGYLYLLFEHKSYGSRDVSLQLLKYMTEIWSKDMEEKKLGNLPVIIPLVIYHGKTRWNIDKNLGGIIEGYYGLSEGMQEYIPDFKYLIYDLSSFTQDEIKGQVINKIILTTFKNIQNEDLEGMIKSILDAARYLNELEDKKRATEYFEILIKYIYSARIDFTQNEVKRIYAEVEYIYPEGSEIIMSLAERLEEEALERGLEKGRLEGEIKTVKKNIRNILFSRFELTDVEVNKKLEKLDDILILDSLFNKAISIESLDEFKRILDNVTEI